MLVVSSEFWKCVSVYWNSPDSFLQWFPLSLGATPSSHAFCLCKLMMQWYASFYVCPMRHKSKQRRQKAWDDGIAPGVMLNTKILLPLNIAQCVLKVVEVRRHGIHSIRNDFDSLRVGQTTLYWTYLIHVHHLTFFSFWFCSEYFVHFIIIGCLGRSHYILWLTIWRFLFIPPTCHKCSLQSFLDIWVQLHGVLEEKIK